MSLRAISRVFAVLTVVVAASLPATAQGFDTQNQQIAQPNLPNIGRPYDLRVTTGARSNAGWEKSLTDGDPNLRHWTWMPVTNYDQGYIHVPAGASGPGAAAPQRPAHVYVKPTTLPLPINPVYTKPFKPVIVNYGLPTNSGGSHANTKVGGHLVAHQAVKPVTAPAYTKTYGGGYGDLSGHLMPSRNAISDSSSVSGKLLTRTH